MKLNQDIVLNIHGNFFKVLAEQNLEWFLVPVLRDTSLPGVAWVLNPVTEAVMLGYYLTQLSGLRLEIRHILFKLDNPQGRKLRLFQYKEIHNPRMVFFVSIKTISPLWYFVMASAMSTLAE